MTAVTTTPAPSTPGPARRRIDPPELGSPTRVTLLALLTVLTFEAVRASGPLLDRAFATGVVVAGVTALGTYLAAGLVAAALLLGTGRARTGVPTARTLLVGTAVLGVLRLVVQGLDEGARYAVGLTLAAVAVGVLTLAVAFVRDPRTQYVPMQTVLSRDDALMEYLVHTGSGLYAVPPGVPDGTLVLGPDGTPALTDDAPFVGQALFA